MTYGLKDNNVEGWGCHGRKICAKCFLTIRNIDYIFFFVRKNHSTSNNVNFFVYEFFLIRSGCGVKWHMASILGCHYNYLVQWTVDDLPNTFSILFQFFFCFFFNFFSQLRISKNINQDSRPFNLHPEKWFEGYPVKSTQIFIGCTLIFIGYSLDFFLIYMYETQHFSSCHQRYILECSKQFKWNLYFYVPGLSGPFWAVLKLL